MERGDSNGTTGLFHENQLANNLLRGRIEDDKCVFCSLLTSAVGNPDLTHVSHWQYDISHRTLHITQEGTRMRRINRR